MSNVMQGLLAQLQAAPTAIVFVDGEPHRVRLDEHGVLRFVGSPIVRKLYHLTCGDGPPWRGYGMNEIVTEFWEDVRSLRRFYIEIGYSLSGFLEIADHEGAPPMVLTLEAP